MIIVGAKGFAKEVLEIAHQLNQLKNLVFYDDVNEEVPDLLYGQFPVLKSVDEAANYFDTVDNKFTIGIGNPALRKKMYDKFINIGGLLTSTISPYAVLGSYDISIGEGANILPGSIFSNSIETGIGCLFYYNSIITHDCRVGDFVEISPGAILLGRCQIDSYSQIGSNATILPDIKIGKNTIVGSGSVVTRDIPDNCIVIGIPACIKKQLPPLEY